MLLGLTDSEGGVMPGESPVAYSSKSNRSAGATHAIPGKADIDCRVEWQPVAVNRANNVSGTSLSVGNNAAGPRPDRANTLASSERLLIEQSFAALLYNVNRMPEHPST
jgi:hypothetical protein